MRVRERRCHCDKCGKVAVIRVEFDPTPIIKAAMPDCCESKDACARQFAAGILDRPFDSEGAESQPAKPPAA